MVSNTHIRKAPMSGVPSTQQGLQKKTGKKDTVPTMFKFREALPQLPVYNVDPELGDHPTVEFIGWLLKAPERTTSSKSCIVFRWVENKLAIL